MPHAAGNTLVRSTLVGNGLQAAAPAFGWCAATCHNRAPRQGFAIV